MKSLIVVSVHIRLQHRKEQLRRNLIQYSVAAVQQDRQELRGDCRHCPGSLKIRAIDVNLDRLP